MSHVYFNESRPLALHLNESRLFLFVTSLIFTPCSRAHAPPVCFSLYLYIYTYTSKRMRVGYAWQTRLYVTRLISMWYDSFVNIPALFFNHMCMYIYTKRIHAWFACVYVCCYAVIHIYTHMWVWDACVYICCHIVIYTYTNKIRVCLICCYIVIYIYTRVSHMVLSIYISIYTPIRVPNASVYTRWRML